MKYLPLVWASVWRKPTRTLFTLLAILVAFLLFGLLQGVNAAFNRNVESAHADRLFVLSKISMRESMPYSHLAKIEAVPGVGSVAYASASSAYYQDPRNSMYVFAVDADRFFGFFDELIIPSAQLRTMTTTRTGALASAETAAKYGWRVGDRIPVIASAWSNAEQGSSWVFDLVGIYQDPSHTNRFIVNYDYVDSARTSAKGMLTLLFVRVAPAADPAMVAESIDALFMNSADETSTQTESEFARFLVKQIGDINLIVSAIIGAVFFTLLFMIANGLMQSLRERRGELAVMKTLGFSDTGVLALVLLEVLLLCGLGALLGLAGAALLLPAAKAVIGSATLPPAVVATGLGLSVLLALVTGAVPAWLAKRIAIVDALRGQ